MAKGEVIVVVLRAGERLESDGHTARANGRKITGELEKDSGITWLVVRETTRGGTVVKEARYQLADVVSWTHDRE